MPRLNVKLTPTEKKQYQRPFDTGRIYMAEVMDVRNISRSGDLLVYLIGSDLDKNDEHNWIHASYASNFFGTTPYEAQSNSTYENSPQSFGQWFPIPCVGNFVFVFFPVSSAENVMCYWFACPVNPFTNYMLPGIPSAEINGERVALCERNDKCNLQKENDKKTSINENKTNGNIVNGKEIISDEDKLQQLIKDNDIPKDTVDIILRNMDVDKTNGVSQKNNYPSLSRYMNDQGIKNYKTTDGTEFASLLVKLYNDDKLSTDNLKQFYESSDKLANELNKEDSSTSGSCSNNIIKQKSYFNDIKASERIQAKYEPINIALKEQGLDKDDVRGYSTAGAKRDCPGMCYGIKTPLGNTFVMDDGFRDDDNKTVWKWKINGKDDMSGQGDPKQVRRLVGNGGLSPWQRKPRTPEDERKNAGFRLRTRNGTQILIADEGTVYMINRDGSCWVEMTKNGYLEGYSEKGVAISSDGDINLHSSRNIYIECDETLAVKAKNINIETSTGNSEGKSIGGDINIAKTAHINTEAVISANKIYANEGKIDVFESKFCKMIGRFAGYFWGHYKDATAQFFNSHGLKEDQIPEVLSVKDENNKCLIEPKEEEKVDVDGQGYSEDNQKKIEKTINTKITTHEPYCGHCKYTPKKRDKEKEEKEKKEEEKKKEQEKKEQENKEKNNNTQKPLEKNAQTNAGQINNNCSGCNTSSGCCGNSSCSGSGCSGNSAPTTSCTGCSGVTNQVNKGFLNEIPASNKKFEDKKLSDYFNLSDLIQSNVAKANGINNVPTDVSVEKNLQSLTNNILDKLKEKYPNLQITSCYRSEQLNDMLENSSTNSQHLVGQACDVKVPGVSPYEVAQYIKYNMDYDQLILENPDKNNISNGWVHVSYKSIDSNRHSQLTTQGKISQSGIINL